MTGTASRFTPAVAAAVGLLAGVAAAFGVFARGDGSSVLVTSARGEVYEMASTGAYANNAIAVVAEGVGWDLFTLALAAPAICLGAWLTARGGLRGALFTTGMLGYFAYMYLEYSVTWAFGPLFPLFVTIAALSVVGLVFAATLLAARTVAFSERYPRRSWAVLSGGMAVLLTALWTERILTATRASTPTLYGHTTMTVQALDLGLVVPVSAIIAVGVWRRLPAGMVAGAAFGVTFVAMALAIAAMMISSSIVTGALQLPPIVIFGIAGVAGLLVVARMYGCVAPAPIHSQRPEPVGRGPRRPAEPSLGRGAPGTP